MSLSKFSVLYHFILKKQFSEPFSLNAPAALRHIVDNVFFHHSFDNRLVVYGIVITSFGKYRSLNVLPTRKKDWESAWPPQYLWNPEVRKVVAQTFGAVIRKALPLLGKLSHHLPPLSGSARLPRRSERVYNAVRQSGEVTRVVLVSRGGSLSPRDCPGLSYGQIDYWSPVVQSFGKNYTRYPRPESCQVPHRAKIV